MRGTVMTGAMQAINAAGFREEIPLANRMPLTAPVWNEKIAGAWNGEENSRHIGEHLGMLARTCHATSARRLRMAKRARRGIIPASAPIPHPIHTDWDDLIKMIPEWKNNTAEKRQTPEEDNGPGSEKDMLRPGQGKTDIPMESHHKRTTMPRYVLAVGTTPNKNLARIAEALQGLPCRLLVLGKPDEADRLLLSCLTPGYQYCSGLSEKEVALLYQTVAGSGGILLFPSLYEGFGRPILEAQNMGIPVITSMRSPMREVAGEGALLVDPTDTWEIRRAVQRLLFDHILYRKIQIRGLLNARRFESREVACAYAKIYREISSTKDAAEIVGQGD